MYKHNYDKNHPISVPSIEPMSAWEIPLIRDVIHFNHPLLVADRATKEQLAHKMYRMGQLNLASVITETYAYEHLLLLPKELAGHHAILTVFVHPSCTDSEIRQLQHQYPNLRIKNGFVHDTIKTHNIQDIQYMHL